MRYRYQHRGQVYEIELERMGDGYRATIDGQPYELKVLALEPGQIDLLFAGQPTTVFWAVDADSRWISLDGCTYRLEKPAGRHEQRAGQANAESSVRAPMPAQVQAIHVTPGAVVDKGDTLMMLEAMKMEIRIQAPRAGVILRLAVSEGDAVERDALLAEIGAAQPSGEVPNSESTQKTH